MTDQRLPHVELCTGDTPTASVIWLHGLGSDGNDFVPVVQALDLPGDTAIRFIFPHAPKQAMTFMNGCPLRAWYDVNDMDLTRRVDDEQGFKRSRAQIEAFIDHEITRGISAEKIVVAGFSQGGAMAYHTGLRYREKLAGILALSTYLHMKHSLSSEASPANRDTPIFIGHGQDDRMISLGLAQQSRDFLARLNYPVEWHEFPMDHELCQDEINRISAWLIRVLKR